ncbi:MAG TPA: aspartate/glutamate racemase family protein [Aggregatilineales bacterium]|nr:aspartate/glutamate racemase family protein [Aggregatilineales bacterium]
MKVIGLIGGMSWQSSLEYYRLINQLVQQRLGGQNNAVTLMSTVNFHDIEQMQREARWDEMGVLLADVAQRLERGGADFVILCTNTMHRVAPAIQRAVSIPLIHIASATADRIQRAGLQKIGLLGTKFTMEQDFYKGILTRDYGLEVLIPEEAERNEIHRIIYDELCLGTVRRESRRTYAQIMRDLEARGAQGIILGCTEITLLVKAEDSSVAQFDTTLIHAERAVELALE